MSKHTPAMAQGIRTYRLEDDGRTIFANPIETKREGGSSFTLGFPVCKVEEFVSTPEVVAELLNRGEHFESLLRAFQELADAADEVGVNHFDTDTMDPDVQAMQMATQGARAAIAKARGE